MEFNATFNNISIISWQSVFLVEETGVITIILDIILDGLHVFIPLCNMEWMIYLMWGLCGGRRGRDHMVAGFTTAYIFTVSVSVFLCVLTDITGGCRWRCVETSCDAGFKLWILYNQSLTSSVKYSDKIVVGKMNEICFSQILDYR
jgi:hypothetical protein